MPESFPLGTAGSGDNAVSAVLDSTEYRSVIERNNRQNKLEIDDDSMESCSRSSLSSHSCSKHSSVEGDDECNAENAQNRSQ